MRAPVTWLAAQRLPQSRPALFFATHRQTMTDTQRETDTHVHTDIVIVPTACMQRMSPERRPVLLARVKGASAAETSGSVWLASPSSTSSPATASSYTRVAFLFLISYWHGSNQPSGRVPPRSSSAAPKASTVPAVSPASLAHTRRQHCRPKQTSSPHSAQPRIPSRAPGTRRQRF